MTPDVPAAVEGVVDDLDAPTAASTQAHAVSKFATMDGDLYYFLRGPGHERRRRSRQGPRFAGGRRKGDPFPPILLVRRDEEVQAAGAQREEAGGRRAARWRWRPGKRGEAAEQIGWPARRETEHAAGEERRGD